MASYALDRHSAVRHVATRLWRAGDDEPAPTVAELADSYNKVGGFNRSDLARIRKYEHRKSNYDALVWLIQEALCLLGDQIKPDGNGGYRLAVDWEALRYNDRPLVPDDLEAEEVPRPKPVRARGHVTRADDTNVFLRLVNDRARDRLMFIAYNKKDSKGRVAQCLLTNLLLSFDSDEDALKAYEAMKVRPKKERRAP